MMDKKFKSLHTPQVSVPEGQYASPTEIGQYILAATQLERNLSSEKRRAVELEQELDSLRSQHDATVKALILEHHTVNEFRVRIQTSINTLESHSVEQDELLTRVSQQTSTANNLAKNLESRFSEHHHALSHLQTELKALQPLMGSSEEARKRLERLEKFSSEIRERFLKEAELVRKYLSWVRDQIQFLRTTTAEHTEQITAQERSLEGMRSQYSLEHSMTQEQVREKLSSASLQLQKMAVQVEAMLKDRKRDQDFLDETQKRYVPWIDTLRKRSEELESRQKAYEENFKVLYHSIEKLQTAKDSGQVADRKKIAAEHALLRQEVLNLRQELKELKKTMGRERSEPAPQSERGFPTPPPFPPQRSSDQAEASPPPSPEVPPSNA